MASKIQLLQVVEFAVGKAPELLAATIWYDEAPDTAVQLNVGVVDWFVAPLDGDSSVGGAP